MFILLPTYHDRRNDSRKHGQTPCATFPYHGKSSIHRKNHNFCLRKYTRRESYGKSNHRPPAGNVFHQHLANLRDRCDSCWVYHIPKFDSTKFPNQGLQMFTMVSPEHAVWVPRHSLDQCGTSCFPGATGIDGEIWWNPENAMTVMGKSPINVG